MENAEITKNPIFLFQHRQCIPTEDYFFGDYGYCHECEAIYEAESEQQHNKEHENEDYLAVTEEQLIKDGAMMAIWHTVKVFYSRKEANDHGKANSHNYGAWRVYCVPAHGKLVKALNDYEAATEAVHD